MANTITNISIPVASDKKAQTNAPFNEPGMSPTVVAINILPTQSLHEGRILFNIAPNQPSKETIAAMLEAERIAKDPTVKHYRPG